MIDVEHELAVALTTETAREIIMSQHGTIDEAIFARAKEAVLQKGSYNFTDVAIIYDMIMVLK